MKGLLAGTTAGTTAVIAVWQTAIALPPGPTDVRLVLAGLVIPVLAAGGSLLTIAAAEGRTEQPASVPTQRRTPAPARRELSA
ncbi:hypothetical protein ABZ738_05390 [Micromonospora sp. NPDC047793]|uniref:hypothetical protein n=1 Tax=Micromonospora sp. NPDC047793 TaxID=3154342 RepID=UPI0034115DEA